MEAKNYMSRREIANLFECLMTGLMYHRPDNYVEYLIECLNKINALGVDTVRWDLFLEAKRAKTPLPPIAPTNGLSREASLAASRNGEIKPSTPLPPIGSAVQEETDNGLALKPNVPLFVIVGGPGCSKGSYCEALTEHFPGLTHISTGGLLREKAGQEHQEAIKKGDLLPDDVVISLLTDTIKAACDHTKGILLTGFPRSQSQVSLLKEKIGAVQQVLLIDYEEDDLMYTLERRRNEGGRDDDTEEASSRRVAIFKEQTLHVCKHFEDAGKLTLIDGNRSREVIIAELAKILQSDFGEPTQVQLKFPSPRPPSVPRPSKRRPNHFDHETVQEEEEVEEYGGLRIRKLRLKDQDTGRREGLMESPIVLLMGGPGSGRSTQAAKTSSRYGFVHVDIDSCDGNSVDVLQRLRDLGEDVKGVILEGFPASEENLNDFNRVVGGVNLAILIDCYEDVLRQRCEAQERLQPYIDQEISKFKEHTLPVVRHYDLAEKLCIVLGDQPEDEVFSLITEAIDSKVLKQDSDENKEASQPAHDETDAGAPETSVEGTAEAADTTDAPESTPAEAAEGAPAEAAEGAPAEVAKDAPAEAAEEAPAEAAKDAPPETAEDTSAEKTDEVAAEKTEDTPAEAAAEPTAEVPAEMPAEAETPAVGEDAPAAVAAAEEPSEAAAEKPEGGTTEAQEAEVVPEAAAELEQSPEEILKSLKVVFVIGGPGSGKGTQCEKILEKFQVGHVSTGDLMRAEVQSGSELGQKLKDTMEKGELVTLDTVLELLKAALVKMGKDKKCFLVDGFPREKDQGVRFENEVTECSVCLFFDVPNEVMTERLLKRGESSGRVDDNEETIRARLKTFSDNTDPILEYFEGKGKLARIDATGTIDEIYSKVDKILEDASVQRQ